MEKIYLDHAATTPIHPQVLKKMNSIQQEIFGNPSSIHSFGRESRAYVDHARKYIAHTLGAKDHEVIFTSGGTEADNLALFGVAHAYKDLGNHLIVSAQEHMAILDAAKQLETVGFQVTYLPVDKNGLVSVQDVDQALTEETILVSIMYANNETGIIQPIHEIAEHLQNHQAFFHTDAVQAYGQLNIDVKEQSIDLLTGSAHKMNGPKGAGFLYVADGIQLNALQYGGEQERKRRPGTENIAGMFGFEQAAKIAFANQTTNAKKNQENKQAFLTALRDEGIDFSVNGDQAAAISSIVNISFPGTDVEQLLTNLDLAGIAASSGSACTAGTLEPSHVLAAMYGKSDERTRNSIRFSFGLGHTKGKMIDAAKRISGIIKRLTE